MRNVGSKSSLFTALAASVAVFAAAPAAASPEAVVDAERSFAADVRAGGFKAGFLAHVAPDAIVFQATPVAAPKWLAGLPSKEPPGPPLHWWPLWAGSSVSGDLGFTTGGATVPLRYFTVWRKQPDGRWKWIYDGGPPLRERLQGGPETPVRYLAPATAAAGSPERALSEIAPLEARLAAAAASDVKAAYLEHLAEDGLVAGSADPGGNGREGQAAELDRRPRRASLRRLGGAASRAGDLAFTYGEVRRPGEAERYGHYARIWQKRKEGWRLVVDMVIPVPEARPNPAGQGS